MMDSVNHDGWRTLKNKIKNGWQPQSNLSEDILQEQVHILYQHAPSLLIGNLFIAALCGLVMHAFSPVWLVVLWVMAVYLLTFARIYLVRRYQLTRKRKDLSSSALQWRTWFLVGACCSGCLWGSMAFIAFHPAEPVSVLFTGIILAGMTGGCVASLSVVPWGYACFAMPATLPFAVRCLLENNHAYWLFGVCAMLLLGINIYYSRVVRQATTNAIALRFENLQLIEELCEAKNIAERASRAKTRFLAAASHDLRQPTHALGLFMGALSRLWEDKAIAADVAPVFAKMQITLDSMSKLLATLLDVSRLDSGAVSVTIAPFPLQRIFTRLSAQFSGSVTNSQQLTIHSTGYWLESDEQLLTQILANLLTNALRYCPDGRVLLGCRKRGNFVDIQIWDTGIGIAQENLNRIFEEFVRLENANSHSSQGMGLGLAIVQRGVKLLNHDIGVHSVLGKGSCFYVRVPLW